MITYVKGDATCPQGKGRKIIVHCCNDIGAWGAGFVMALSRKWEKPEQRYRKWSRQGTLLLGEVQFVSVGSGILVANLIGQRGVGGNPGCPPIRYEAILRGFHTVASKAKGAGASVHMPRMGCGLAGGSWVVMEALITSAFASQADVTVYDFV